MRRDYGEKMPMVMKSLMTTMIMPMMTMITTTIRKKLFL
jgi:hypothetical protein